MKRFSLVLLGGLLLNTVVFAQVNSPVQFGRATHELQYGGLNAAHPTLPLGSRATIVNTETGEEIDVTIISRIPPSSIRIIDLSPAAWKALDLTADTEVELRPVSSPIAGGSTGAAPQVIGSNEESPNGIDIEDIGDEELADAVSLPEAASKKAAPLAKAAPPEAGDKGHAAVVLARTPIKVVPGLPNPNSRKMYRLQVGAYAKKENADFAECALKAAGFETRREARGSLTRVLAVGIAAADVKSAVQAIESAGFGEVWIRE